MYEKKRKKKSWTLAVITSFPASPRRYNCNSVIALRDLVRIEGQTERKTKKEAASAERAANVAATRSEVSKLDAEIKTLRAELQCSRERCQMAEQDAYMLRKRLEQCGDPEVLQARLDVLKEKNRQIENSLSSETKLKMYVTHLYWFLLNPV